MSHLLTFLLRVFKQYRVGVLEIVAFSTGFCLMAYEMVASRILAPTIGSSTYVWTSVIGVIIAALSLGYTAGGILGDKRVKHTDIALLLLATTLAMICTVLLSESLLTFIRDTFDDPRIRGLVASLVLFMPASFALGVISPYLVRLHTNSVQKAGRSMASLSAMNAIGGIVGTFAAGFLFFGFIGSVQTIAVLCVVLVGTSWLIMPREDQYIRFLGTAAVVALAVIAYAPWTGKARAAGVIDIDTTSAHYQVIDTKNSQGHTIRILTNGPQGGQSAVDIDHPEQLVFGYIKALSKVAEQAPAKKRIAVLGGGTYTLPAHLANAYPQSSIDVVEIDPQLLSIAQQYFMYRPAPNVQHIAADARTFLNTNQQKYDLIVADVYSDIAVPFALTTSEYTVQLQRNLAPGGVVLVNAISSASAQCKPLLGSVNSTYRQTFRYSKALALEDWAVPVRQNIILAYSNKRLDWLQANSPHKDITPELPTGTILTDNYAPIERLTFGCK